MVGIWDDFDPRFGVEGHTRPDMNNPGLDDVEPGLFRGKAGNGLLSHPLSRAVPSALRGLTAVFGMGTGVALSR